MKIGILTFHRAINYGAVLQCYALSKVLTHMGHDVEVIDYRSDSIEKYRMFFRKKDLLRLKGIKNKIRYFVSSLFLIPTKKRTSRKFDLFLNDHMKFSKVVKRPDDISNYYDFIFFGSDQIWNPQTCEGLDPIYWGQFEHHNAKFATYAASIGRISLINDKLKSDIRTFIKAYDNISVRERDLSEFLEREFHVPSSIVCDPTILLKKEDYDILLRKPSIKNYLVLYTVEPDVKSEDFAEKISKQMGCVVVRLHAYLSPLKKQRTKFASELSPSEFIGYIANAKCIVTNSFHATSFSIIYRKDFYYLSQKSNRRAQDLMSSLGITNRLVRSDESIIFSHVDYSNIDVKTKEYKESSLNFLTSVLNYEI